MLIPVLSRDAPKDSLGMPEDALALQQYSLYPQANLWQDHLKCLYNDLKRLPYPPIISGSGRLRCKV